MLASPELVHPNKYTKLHDVGDILSGVALLEQTTSTSCQGNDYSSKDWGKNYRQG